MKLERITLENFRQYFSKQRLEFSRDPQKNVTVINGVNGAGKTSMFLAINWCLYGKSVENVKVIDNVGELMSKEAVRRSAPTELIRTMVEITFQHNGSRYMVRRSIQGIKQDVNMVSLYEPDEFIMMEIRPDGQAKKVDNPVGTMNAILSVNVREYFLFDGEKIDNFAKPESARQVKDAIYLVLKLEILERARRHLESLAQEYRRELKGLSSGELRKLIDKDEKLRNEIERHGDRKVEIEQQIELAKRKINEIEQKLRSSPNVNSLQQQRDRLEYDLKLRQGELDELIIRIRDFAANAYFIICRPAIDQAISILESKRIKGEIPSNIRQQFIKDLLDQMTCICGRPVNDGSPEHQKLLGLLTSSLPAVLEDDVLDTSALLKSFGEQIKVRQSNLDVTMKQKISIDDVIKSLRAELDDVGRQLKGSPQEEIQGLENQRQNFLADIESYKMEIGSITTKVDQLEKEISKLENEIAKARKEEKQAILVAEKFDLAQRSADAIANMYQTFADDMREKIKVKTREIFKCLIWKESHFKDIELGPDYNLEVIDRYGLQARPELSAGERQVLSLSFITAMSRVSEEEAPLVMDTPFGRLSSKHRNSITEYLPRLADQLILFVTDEELRDQARENLTPRIGAEYYLVFNPDTSCTSIEEVKK
ncbi:MAG: AAA family ATPase [Anaerolineaceae bacterium]|nr:AAA family ATPase [Anaerolineaceae bacterium]